MTLSTDLLTPLLADYGYLAVLVFVIIEARAFPCDTMLLVAAIYAGTTHNLSTC